MVSNTQKDQILKRLEQHYISPITQFWVEAELLKRTLLGRRSRIQIAMPDSWRANDYLKKSHAVDIQDVYDRLEIFERYLDSDHHSVFAHDKPLILGDSFPYFEWVVSGEIKGLNHLLGRAQLFYIYKGSEEATNAFYSLVEERELMPYAHVIGELPQELQVATEAKGLSYIEDISRPFLEQISKGRSLSNLFNQSADILLMDRYGHYIKSYSRAEFVKQLDQIILEYFD